MYDAVIGNKGVPPASDTKMYARTGFLVSGGGGKFRNVPPHPVAGKKTVPTSVWVLTMCSQVDVQVVYL